MLEHWVYLLFGGFCTLSVLSTVAACRFFAAVSDDEASDHSSY